MLSTLIICMVILLIFIIISLYYIKLRIKKVIERYAPKSNKDKIWSIRPLMIIGPSGVGKDTFMQFLINKYQNIFVKCVSCTTRSPRNNEKHGVNYYFITKEKFNELDKKGEIIGRFEKYNILYGTSKQTLNDTLSDDKIVYFDYNIETAIRTFEEKKVEFNYIALLPPSIEVLENRLRKRGTEDEESIQKRLSYAKKEIELIKNSTFLNYVIENNDLDKAEGEFEQCIKELYPHLFE